MDRLPELVAHCSWANRLWLRYIAESASSDEWLRQRISHVFLGERAWFQRIEGSEPDPDIWTALAFAEIERLAIAHERRYAELFDGGLTRAVSFQRFTGETGQLPIADIVLHLVLHGAHHRGQMATHVSDRGIAPINTDFVQYRLLRRALHSVVEGAPHGTDPS